MEESMELVQAKEDLAGMTDEERDMMQKILSAMIVGVFHSIDKDMAIENVKKELETVAGEEVTDDDLTDAFGKNAVPEIVDMFKEILIDDVVNVMNQVGLDTFENVGYLLGQTVDQKKLTAEE